MSSCTGPGGRRDAFSRASFANFISRSCKDSSCLKRRRCLNMRSFLTVQAEAQQVSQPPVPTGSLAVMQKQYACQRTVPIRMVQAIARERYGRFRRRSLLPGRQAGESMAVPARVSASVRGCFAFRCRNQPTRRSLGDGSQTPPISDAATASPSTIRGLALRMLSSSARPDRSMRPPEKITLRRDARAKRSRRPGSTALNLAVFSCAAAPASPSVKPIRRNDVEAMGPAQKCR